MPTTYIMRDRSIRLLSTMTLEESLIQSAASRNVTIDSASFIQTVSVIGDAQTDGILQLSHQYATVLFTSKNAVKAVADRLKSPPDKWKIYCLGGATHEMVLQRFPNSQVIATAKDAASLGDKVNDPSGPVIFFCGEQRMDDLPRKLADRKIGCREMVVYQTLATPQIINTHYEGIFFYSPSGAESFFSANSISPGTVLFAIGHTTAASLRDRSANRILMSGQPVKKILIEKAIQYFDKLKSIDEQVKK